MTGRNAFDRSLTDALAPIADAAPLPPGLLRVPGSWIRSGLAAPLMRSLAVAAVVGATAVVTLTGIAALRGELSVPFIGAPREPAAIASLAPDEMRSVEEADRIINTTLTAEESAMLVNAHGAVVEACMQELGWDYEVGTATPETESGGPSFPSRLEQWTFADVSSTEIVGYGFESYLAEHAVWLRGLDEAEGEARTLDPDTLKPDDAARFYVDFFGTEEERVEIVERDGSGAGRAGGGCMAEADRALYGDIEREMWLRDARGTAESDIWVTTLEDQAVVEALDWWRDCVAEREVYYADPEQAFSGALKFAQASDHAQERLIASADAVCKVESGLDRAVQAGFLAATNAVLPNLEADLLALQELEEEALARAREVSETTSP
ncbi:MAG: hypothetical protein M3406_18065 [Chloroflexota bacterium]|nr:hypothetical protein [Chloroflexota bacterium]